MCLTIFISISDCRFDCIVCRCYRHRTVWLSNNIWCCWWCHVFCRVFIFTTHITRFVSVFCRHICAVFHFIFRNSYHTCIWIYSNTVVRVVIYPFAVTTFGELYRFCIAIFIRISYRGFRRIRCRCYGNRTVIIRNNGRFIWCCSIFCWC